MKLQSYHRQNLFCIVLLAALLSVINAQTTYYVAANGSDQSGDGSENDPWATITNALDNCSDGAIILVKPGEYSGRIRIRGSFSQGVTVRSEVPYQAQLRHSGTVITAYSDSRGCEGITIEGFDIAHSGAGAEALVFHIDGGGDRSVRNITVRNNVLHDSYNNDILKINNSTVNIIVEGNMFYNQSGSDEHIDINSVDSVFVHDNIFFNDFAGSGRTNENNTSSFIVIKDSNDDEDYYTGTRGVIVNRNIFLNWEGSTGSCFVLCGEDGKPYHESFSILIENNLMLGNSGNVMRSSFGVKGGRDITFRNNTVVGDLPSLAFAMRLNTEGDNPANEDIRFFNNIWSDPTASMGTDAPGGSNDFSDTPPDETESFTLNNNLYWNGMVDIPSDNNELVNYTDDGHAFTADPLLNAPVDITIPRWDSDNKQFSDGSSSISDAFLNLAQKYGVPKNGSPVIGSADYDNVPQDDLLGKRRDRSPDIGCIEYGTSGILRNHPSHIASQSANTFFCYYHSASKTLSVRGRGLSGPGNVQFFDSQGRMVAQRCFPKAYRTERKTISVFYYHEFPQFASGVYFGVVHFGNRRFTASFTVQ